jgi:Xaa-Pro aminopeptidase
VIAGLFLNKQRAIDIMRERGMDALITTSQANNTYLSDLPINGFCILTSEGDGTIIARALDSFILAEAPSWIKDVRLYGLFHIFPSDSKRLSGLEERLNDIVLKGGTYES